MKFVYKFIKSAPTLDKIAHWVYINLDKWRGLRFISVLIVMR